MNSFLFVEDLANSLTLKVKSNGRIGTGFFINQDTVVTCAHIVEPQTDKKNDIEGFKDGMRFKMHIDALFNEDSDDIAILKSEFLFKEHHLRFGVPQSGVLLYGVGHVIKNESKQPFRSTYQGTESGIRDFIKFSDTQVEQQMSGAPLFNTETGEIVGIITSSKSLNMPAGGWAIPHKYFSHYHKKIKFPKFSKPNSSGLLIENNFRSKGIGVYDCTHKETHFSIFPSDEIKISDIFIEDNFKLSIRHNEVPSYVEIEEGGLLNKIAEILEQNRLLFITGTFGTGKTILSKIIQKTLIDFHYDTIFLNAFDLNNISSYHDFLNLLKERTNLEIPLVVFIDAFDEINYIMTDKGKNYDRILETLFRSVADHSNLYLVINFRSLDLNKNKLFGDIELFSSSTAEIERLFIIECNKFENIALEKWLKNHSNAMAKQYDIENELFKKDIKVHKGFLEACRNPLFLYIVSNAFFNRKIDLGQITDLNLLFDNFVENTIKGKYIEEKRTGARPFDRFHRQYENFIELMAIKVAEKMHDKKSIDSTVDPKTEILLESNENIYCVDDYDLKQQILILRDEIAASLGISKEEGIAYDRLRDNALNCYFFKFSGQGYCFRENNVASFILARSLYKTLRKVSTSKHIIENTPISVDEFYTEMNVYKNVQFSSSCIEFLFHLLNKLDAAKEKNLKKFISEFISSDGPKTIENSQDTDFQFKYIQDYNINIVMYLLMLKLNVRPSDQGIYIKKFIRYISITKHISKSTYRIAQRFFKSIILSDFSLYRVSLGGFNLTSAQIRNVTLNQVALFKTIFHENVFSKVIFQLCYINCKLINSRGDVTIDTCNIKDLTIGAPRGVCLYITNSQIENLYIKRKFNKFRGSERRAIALVIEGSTIKSLKIEGFSAKKHIYIKESNIQNFDGSHSSLNLICDGCEPKISGVQRKKVKRRPEKFHGIETFQNLVYNMR